MEVLLMVPEWIQEAQRMFVYLHTFPYISTVWYACFVIYGNMYRIFIQLNAHTFVGTQHQESNK